MDDGLELEVCISYITTILVVKDFKADNPENLVWQSFDFQVDTLFTRNEARKEFGEWPRVVPFIMEER